MWGWRKRRRTSPHGQLGDAGTSGTSNELEEIRTLTEANRHERDRDTERRLVQLRFEAFPHLRPADPPSSWPEAAEERFPGALIPDVTREQLSVETLRSAIYNHGSLLVRGLVDQDAVHRLKADIDATFDAFDAKAGGETGSDKLGWYEPFEHRLINDEVRANKRRGGAILAVESPPTVFDLIEIFNDVGFGQLAHDYFGERPAILARKVTLRRMPRTASGVWHQDGAFMGAGIRSLNVWLALTHCGVDAPSLDVVGRRLPDILPTGNGASQPYGVTSEVAHEVGAGAIVRPVFEPGDALIFDHMCLHATGGDKSMPNGRYAIETWFFAPSTYSAMVHPDEEAGKNGGSRPRDQVPLVF